jgi:hypothetical protein
MSAVGTGPGDRRRCRRRSSVGAARAVAATGTATAGAGGPRSRGGRRLGGCRHGHGWLRGLRGGGNEGVGLSGSRATVLGPVPGLSILPVERPSGGASGFPEAVIEDGHVHELAGFGTRERRPHALVPSKRRTAASLEVPMGTTHTVSRYVAASLLTDLPRVCNKVRREEGVRSHHPPVRWAAAAGRSGIRGSGWAGQSTNRAGDDGRLESERAGSAISRFAAASGISIPLRVWSSESDPRRGRQPAIRGFRSLRPMPKAEEDGGLDEPPFCSRCSRAWGRFEPGFEMGCCRGAPHDVANERAGSTARKPSSRSSTEPRHLHGGLAAQGAPPPAARVATAASTTHFSGASVDCWSNLDEPTHLLPKNLRFAGNREEVNVYPPAPPNVTF